MTTKWNTDITPVTISWNTVPERQRFAYERLTFYFKCPYCKRQRQLIELRALVCGAVICHCGSKFRILHREVMCEICKFKMKCLAEGVVKIHKTKDEGFLVETGYLET